MPLIRQSCTPRNPWHGFQYSSSVPAVYILGIVFKSECCEMNGWGYDGCSESGNFAAWVALMVRNSSFLVHSRSNAQCINQSSFLAEPDGWWLTCAKRQNAKLSKVVRESFPPRNENQKAISKSTKFPPSSKDSERINSPALSTSIWTRLDGFFRSVSAHHVLATTVLAC